MARILVIDDQKDVRSVISIVLRVNRFEVVEAANAAEGLKAFEEGHFDAAIVDVFLDDAIGFDVIAKMRASVPDLPVMLADFCDRSKWRLSSSFHSSNPKI